MAYISCGVNVVHGFSHEINNFYGSAIAYDGTNYNFANKNITNVNELSATTYKVGSTVQFQDLVLETNSNLQDLTGLQTGIRLNRASGLDPYYVVFDEDTDRIIAGRSGVLKNVALQSSSLSNGYMAVYNSTNGDFENSAITNTALNTLSGYVNQDLKTSARPGFAGINSTLATGDEQLKLLYDVTNVANLKISSSGIFSLSCYGSEAGFNVNNAAFGAATSRLIYTQNGTQNKPRFLIEYSSAETDYGSGSSGLTLFNGNTTTNNFTDINFGGNDGTADCVHSSILARIVGREAGNWVDSQIEFYTSETSTGSQTEPSLSMLLDKDKKLRIDKIRELTTSAGLIYVNSDSTRVLLQTASSTSGKTSGLHFKASATVDGVREKAGLIFVNGGSNETGSLYICNNITADNGNVNYSTDAKITLDNSGNILLTPTAFVSTTGTFLVDTVTEKTSSSGVTIENVLLKDGAITLNTVVYKKINAPLVLCGVEDPTITLINTDSFYANVFSASATNRASFQQTLPSDYKNGTDITLIINFTNYDAALTADQAIYFKLDHNAGNIDGTFSSACTTISSAVSTNSLAALTQYTNHILAIGTITGTTFTKGATIIGQVRRMGADVLDTCTNPIAIINIQLKYQSDSLGSTS